MDEHLYWLAFSNCYGIGPVRFTKLLDAFGTAKNAWGASISDLTNVLGKAAVLNLDRARKSFSISDYTEKLKKANVHYFILTEENYPRLLKKINHPPYVIYVKGDINFNDTVNSKTIAVVGTRNVTEYGKHVTRKITSELVSAGCVIVSGLALGVDSTAHTATVRMNGRTIAVLGCGVDCCTPRENENLYHDILTHNGAIVSEYPLGAVPTKGSFPQRNRIIAGLSLGVLVTEGAGDSGSLYTARDAMKIGRSVFAVPGPITSSYSEGPNELIRQGAKLVITAQEILDVLNISAKMKKRNSAKVIKADTPEEQKIINILQKGDFYFDEIVRKTQIHSSQLGSILSLMEIKGYITNLQSGLYRIKTDT